MPDPTAGSRAATACKDCGSTENVHTHCAGTLPLCPDCLPNHVEPARATPERAAKFNSMAKEAGKKRAEQVVPDPQFLPWFQLGFIDGAYWAAHLLQQEATND